MQSTEKLASQVDWYKGFREFDEAVSMEDKMRLISHANDCIRPLAGVTYADQRSLDRKCVYTVQTAALKDWNTTMQIKDSVFVSVSCMLAYDLSDWLYETNRVKILNR